MNTRRGRPRSPISAELPRNLTIEGDRIRYRNPITGKRVELTEYGTEQAKAFATQANDELGDLVENRRRARRYRSVTFAELVEDFIELASPSMPWNANTRQVRHYRLRRLARDLGGHSLPDLGHIELGEYLHSLGRPSLVMDYRELLVMLWRWAISKGWATVNEADGTWKPSESKKLAVNLRVRRRLSVPDYFALRAAAEPWLQVAMDLSLATAQSRAEIVAWRFDDVRNGRLYTIREKTASSSSRAFLGIRCGQTLEQVIGRARLLKPDSPYIVHRAPSYRGKPTGNVRGRARKRQRHWTQVTPRYLTNAFRSLVDGSGRFDDLTRAQRPTFHEIRSLASRAMRAEGKTDEAIQTLLTHTDRDTTAIYLENPDRLTDQDFLLVEPGIDIDWLERNAEQLKDI